MTTAEKYFLTVVLLYVVACVVCNALKIDTSALPVVLGIALGAPVVFNSFRKG